MLGTCCIGSDEREVDVRLRQGTELLLCLFASFLEPLQGHGILSKVDPVVLLELVGNIVDQGLVEVVTAQMRITAGRDHFKDLAAVSFVSGKGDFHHGNVERSTTQIEDDDFVVFRLIESIGQGSSGWLVDDSGDFETGNLASVLGGLSLSVIEVGRHRDDRFGDSVTEVGFRRFLQLTEDLGGDFLRRVLLVSNLNLDVLARIANDRVGTIFSSDSTSECRRPMKRLTE